MEEDKKGFVENVMMALSKELVIDIQLNWKKYGIKKKTDLDIINDRILKKCFIEVKKLKEELGLN